MSLDKRSNLAGSLTLHVVKRGAGFGSGGCGRKRKFADADDSRVYPRHTAGAAAVASFRTWRSSRRAVARGPAIIFACKPDGFAKSPTAALRSTLVTAAYLTVRLIPRISQALHMNFLLCRKIKKWRRERDSNPRYAINVHTLSRRAPSTARTSLHLIEQGI